MTAVEESTRRLFEDTLVWDAHSGFEAWPHTDLTNLRIWKDAGVDYLSVNVGYDVQTLQDTIRALATFRRWMEDSDDYQVVGTVSEARSCREAGTMAVAFDIEGMSLLTSSLDVLHLLHELGVRQALFAYNRNNDVGGGCHDDDQGLTEFGRTVVDEMNEIGMLVDCSHCGYQTSMEAMERSSSPTIFSHSNPRTLCDHQRNIVDQQALTCAQTGGVVGINGIGTFLDDTQLRSATMADHIEYLLDLVGDAHVGIGLDYFFESDVDSGFNDVLLNNAHYWPKEQYPDGAVGCAHPRQLVEVAQELLSRGRSEKAVRGVLGENFARVASVVWGN